MKIPSLVGLSFLVASPLIASVVPSLLSGMANNPDQQVGQLTSSGEVAVLNVQAQGFSSPRIESVPIPDTFPLFAVAFVALAVWHQRSRRRGTAASLLHR